MGTFAPLVDGPGWPQHATCASSSSVEAASANCEFDMLAERMAKGMLVTRMLTARMAALSEATRGNTLSDKCPIAAEILFDSYHARQLPDNTAH